MAGDFFKSLKLDEWYMIFVYLGGILLFFSIFVPTQWIRNKQLILFSSGMLLIGLGEWKNHKYISGIKPPNVYTGPAAFIQTKIRHADMVGNILISIGIILIVLGFIDLMKVF